MNFVEGVFFFYIFAGLYMLFLLVFLYLPNRHRMYESEKGVLEPVSIVMPCYNEGKHIGQAIESLLNLDYPKDMLEIIVVDDRSTDDSAKIVREYTKKYDNVRLIVNARNSGRAAEPTNIGVRAAKYAYIAVADADSTPERDALKKMIGFLQNDAKVGAVTCSVLAKNPKSFMQKMQAIEYTSIAFTRKLLDLIDSVYVTPGPFALYKKKVLLEVGLFDTNNMTQDIEIVWKLMSHGYKARMCLSAKVYSTTPDKFMKWFKQRIRWNIGGTQTLIKHRSSLFRKEMLGQFIIPYFSFNLFIGVVGFLLFLYLIIKRIFITYLITKYSYLASTSLIYLKDITFAPSILNFFGFAMFILGASFTIIGLGVMNYPRVRNGNIFNILFYMVVYLSIYPVIMMVSLYKLMRGKYTW